MAESVFKISIPDEKIYLLQQKLQLITFPDELEDAGWDYGVPLADIRRLAEREHEAQINTELPQFTRDIDVTGHGILNIHYVHQKSEVPDAIPLLFVHGWPGNFLEVRKILPLLVESSPDHPSFNVVAFSLPGYGFSEAPRKKVTQGGDLGFQITRRIARNYGGRHSKAWHTNFPLPVSLFHLQSIGLSYTSFHPYTPFEKAGLERTKWFEAKGRGYHAEHATQPQTLGYSLADSPVGLLAWIYEKMVNWTDSYPWDDDEVLTWISSYFFSRAGPAATLRIYYELVNGEKRYPPPSEAPTIPLGFSYFPKELINVPRTWKRCLGKVVFESEHESGGHFAAHEKPEELVADVRKMFEKKGPAFGIVSGKTGYA
ncbi:Alpha/Beta hydrolase protein [Mycena sp. CBHHK59/15]|nr:Alpha/Beta hydrolase protein [Mycena sp. CBHHK59/15]